VESFILKLTALLYYSTVRMSAEHDHAAGVPFLDELAHEAADVWANFDSIIGLFLFGILAMFGIFPEPEVRHGGH